ncbi:hypothetical protein H4Q26_012357 [Puccinia striiformis f. sp. tritici PST-130]|nr:hypothetical protein H4Q26_012357 [Puccinia striiformis f. sp. tritici PST-130]
MAPRSFSKVVCACNRCIQFKYYDETGAHSGQLVGAGTRKAHVSADARVALLARAANEEEQPFDPSELTIDLPEDDLEDLEDKTLPIAVDEPHELDTDVPAQLAPITEPDQLLESLAGLAVVDDVIEYNCSRFHKATTYDKTHPAVLLISLKIALFYVTELSSLYTSTCLLQLDCMLMELMIAQSLSSPSSPKEIPFEHKVDDFGKDPEEEPEDQQVELAHQTIPTDDQAFRELLLDIQVDSSEDERQLEITYLTNFGRVSNLKALLQSGNFPPSLEPFIRQIRALYEPIPFIRQAQVQTCQTPLENEWFLHLVTRLNELFPVEDHKWAASDDWHRSKSQNTLAPVNSRVRVVSNFKKGEEIYTSMKTNKNNCVVALKPDAKLKYGMIDRIFLHSRTPPGLPLQTDTWLALKPLHPVPATNNPFAQLDKYAFDVTLRTLQDDPIYIVHSDELLAHCAWLKYRPRELHPKITSETYAWPEGSPFTRFGDFEAFLNWQSNVDRNEEIGNLVVESSLNSTPQHRPTPENTLVLSSETRPKASSISSR